MVFRTPQRNLSSDMVGPSQGIPSPLGVPPKPKPHAQQRQNKQKTIIKKNTAALPQSKKAAEQMFHFVDLTLPPSQSVSTTTPPSYLQHAIESCTNADNILSTHNNSYPSIYKPIVQKREWRWKKAERDQNNTNIIQMLNDKLGGYYYATKMGVQTAKILYCGVAKDLPRDISSLGDKYVIKPLHGWSAKGVKVVVNGVNILNKKDTTKSIIISYDSLVDEYGSDGEIFVEELIESAHLNYVGRIPPDYKFHVYEGIPELMFRVDRNVGHECADMIDVTSASSSSSEGWNIFEGLQHEKQPTCNQTNMPNMDISRQNVMMDAVRKLASKIGENWLRIDMYDSDHGPILGEFTPSSGGGKESPLASCVMSYLFISHAYHNDTIDDAGVIMELKEKYGLIDKQTKYTTISELKKKDNNDFYPVEAQQWKTYTQMQRCNKVMEAQKEAIIYQ